MTLHERIQTVICFYQTHETDILRSLTVGISFTWAWNQFIPWFIHFVGVLITGTVSTIFFFFLNKWLKKKFPS